MAQKLTRNDRVRKPLRALSETARRYRRQIVKSGRWQGRRDIFDQLSWHDQDRPK